MITFVCKTGDYQHHLGDELPVNLEVEMVIVYTTSLTSFQKIFPNLPFRYGNFPLKFRGDLAWFIYDNL